MGQSIFDSSWFIILFAVVLVLLIGCGILYAVRFKKKNKWESSGIENAVVGIFGLIISFTFLQAGNAHRERYVYIHRQANNIDMLYQQSKEMPDSFYRQTKLFLLAFLSNQITYKQQSNDQEFLSNATEIIDSYWVHLRYYKKQNANLNNVNQLNKISECLDQIKSSFVLNAYSYNERTPSLVMFLLVIMSLLIGFLVGFMNAIKSEIHYLVPLIYFVMITLTMMVITDLNNPFTGSIKPTYHHLKVTYEYIKNN